MLDGKTFKMKKMKIYRKTVTIASILLIFLLASCELDERIDDLTGGYEGAFIDKNTNEVVYTEYYGAKLRLLDLAYGEVAQPLDFYVLPDGTFRNTKVFPSEYKIWADGPFIELDTIQNQAINSPVKFDIKVVPNVSLKIESSEVLYGIGMKIKYSYKINDTKSTQHQIGLVYSDLKYPGYKNSSFAGVDASALAIKYLHTVTGMAGTFTDIIYVNPNTEYFVRATGHTKNAGDYWNYSEQIKIKTSSFDVAAIPVSVKVGARSNSSAVLDIPLPALEGLNYKVEYQDKDGKNVTDILTGSDYAYVANLPENKTTNVKVSLVSGDVSGNPATVAVATRNATERYLENNCNRPANVPLYYSEDMKYSISDWQVQTNLTDAGWKTDPSRYLFIEWWSDWSCSWLPGSVNNLPTCQQMANSTKLTLAGNITTLVDILPFTNLQTLTIEAGGALFSTGKTVSAKINLKPLLKLPNLTKVVIGAGVPLTKADFDTAGLSGLTIVKL